jgi:hypothetical protein
MGGWETARRSAQSGESKLDSESVALEAKTGGSWLPPSLFLQLKRTLLATVALVVSRQPWATCRPALGWKYDSRTHTVSGTSQELSWERGPSS